MDIEITQKKYEKIIVKCILKFVNPEGIFLYGGYGRNEGSWLIEKDKLQNPTMILIFYWLLTNN